MNCCRLIYQSTSTQEVIENDELLELVRKASDYNKHEEITGLLVLVGNKFLQVLEGDADKVNALFQRISKDQRHHSVKIISYESETEACFTEWNMRLVDLYDLPMDHRQHFMDKYDHSDGAIEIPKKVPLVYSLLLDAQFICLNKPWQS